MTIDFYENLLKLNIFSIFVIVLIFRTKKDD
jgi:hypothetical protein